MKLNIPYGIYVSTNEDLDAKFRVADNDERSYLILQDKVKKGHIIFNEAANGGVGQLQYLKEYPTLGSLEGVVWEAVGTGATSYTGGGSSDITIVNDDTTGGVAVAASAEIVKIHGEEIDLINTDLSGDDDFLSLFNATLTT